MEEKCSIKRLLASPRLMVINLVLIGLMVLGAVGGYVYAEFFYRDIPFTVVVEPNTQRIVIQDMPGGNFITDLGPKIYMDRGTTHRKHWLITNDGVETLDLQVIVGRYGEIDGEPVFTPGQPDWASVEVDPFNLGVLQAGETAELTITLTVPLSTPLGEYSDVVVRFD